MHCRARWEDLAALVPAFPFGTRPVAEQCTLKNKKGRLHVSFFGFGAVGCGSVSSLLKGKETPVHDLVNLSCDYLLNTNKY